MIALILAASIIRRKCEVCHLPTGKCEPLTQGMWDSRSFKEREYDPFEGRFNGSSVFETSGISCKYTGVSCDWESGDFGACPLPIR